MTAKALDGDAQRCFDVGMDRYLSKPFTVDELFNALEEYGGAPAQADGKRPAAVLDPRTMAGIRAMRRPGAPDLYAKVAGIYVSNSSMLVGTIRTAVVEDDKAALLRAAHALKSSSANVGATALAEMCREVEVAANGGDFDLACALVERLLDEHRQVLRALEEQGLAA